MHQVSQCLNRRQLERCDASISLRAADAPCRCLVDHPYARQLAEGLARVDATDLIACDTNMVFATFPEAPRAARGEFLAAWGVLIELLPRTRLETHLGISEADIH
ncbi:hypothetical protein [Halomonas kalidii]|uniref:Uncharacterized protein n=1 Tax=Halomonas kalidii TaxID=3043293 RepID=A0ABT6VER1_9GAMM|nr:hypothetical protein [Halomonas kalidii]MDI5932483.1 hypothetical protein [Halomonas kalidii]